MKQYRYIWLYTYTASYPTATLRSHANPVLRNITPDTAHDLYRLIHAIGLLYLLVSWYLVLCC